MMNNEKDELNNIIKSQGKRNIVTPNKVSNYYNDDDRELYYTDFETVLNNIEQGDIPLSFEKAGSRQKVYYKSEGLKAGIVTCGGLCPGLNDVIRSIVMSLHYQYNVWIQIRL